MRTELDKKYAIIRRTLLLVHIGLDLRNLRDPQTVPTLVCLLSFPFSSAINWRERYGWFITRRTDSFDHDFFKTYHTLTFTFTVPKKSHINKQRWCLHSIFKSLFALPLWLGLWLFECVLFQLSPLTLNESFDRRTMCYSCACAALLRSPSIELVYLISTDRLFSFSALGRFFLFRSCFIFWFPHAAHEINLVGVEWKLYVALCAHLSEFQIVFYLLAHERERCLSRLRF